MKAVLLAGGLGTRMREETEFRPKPMVEVGGRPVLWHIMKLLSSYGIKDFIICTGYKGDFIANYFANYSKLSTDFTINLGDPNSATYHGISHDEADWNVTVAHTGADTNTGGRIKRIQKYIGDEPFFCTYGDGIADVDIAGLIARHQSGGKLATMTTTKPGSRFGIVHTDSDGVVTRFQEKPQTDDQTNIGYFIFEPEVFDYIAGDDTALEHEPLQTLAAEHQLDTFPHEGFWQPMDTQRELELLNKAWEAGAPWKRWD